MPVPDAHLLFSTHSTSPPSLNKPLALELARCEYVVARENVIALGNSGTGKTHLSGARPRHLSARLLGLLLHGGHLSYESRTGLGKCRERLPCLTIISN